MLKFDKFFLYLLARFRQHHIPVLVMPWETEPAVETLVEDAAVLHLLAFVCFTVEFLWFVVEVLDVPYLALLLGLLYCS